VRGCADLQNMLRLLHSCACRPHRPKASCAVFRARPNIHTLTYCGSHLKFCRSRQLQLKSRAQASQTWRCARSGRTGSLSMLTTLPTCRDCHLHKHRHVVVPRCPPTHWMLRWTLRSRVLIKSAVRRANKHPVCQSPLPWFSQQRMRLASCPQSRT
jgi:hypothetical protein